MLPSTCRHRLDTTSTVCAACLRNQLSAILSDQLPDPRIDRSRSCSAASIGFEDSVESAAERCLKSCHVEVENVSVGKPGVNDDVDVCVRWNGRDGRRGLDEVKITKELMADDWKSKKKKKTTWMKDKKTKKDEKEGELRGFWKRASRIRERFSKWKVGMKGSKGSGDVSSIDDGDLFNAVVKQREDLTGLRASKNKVQRRSCDAVLVSEGRGSFDSSRGLTTGKPRLSLDVNLVERSCQFQKLRLEVSNVSDAAGIDNSVPKRLEKDGTWELVGRSGVSQDARIQDSDNGIEGLVAPRLRRRFNRIITNMKVLSPLSVKKGRETPSSRSLPSGTRPISKLLITEKELLEWNSKTRDSEVSSLSH